jgi:hypothetical protein
VSGRDELAFAAAAPAQASNRAYSASPVGTSSRSPDPPAPVVFDPTLPITAASVRVGDATGASR